MAAPKLCYTDTSNDIYHHIHKILMSLGTPPNIKGYLYISHSLELIHSDPELIYSVTKGLYVDVAKKYKTTPSTVERGIRHAIHSTWRHGNEQLLNTIFQNHLNNKTIPSNSVFLARLYYYIEREI